MTRRKVKVEPEAGCRPRNRFQIIVSGLFCSPGTWGGEEASFLLSLAGGYRPGVILAVVLAGPVVACRQHTVYPVQVSRVLEVSSAALKMSLEAFLGARRNERWGTSHV